MLSGDTVGEFEVINEGFCKLNLVVAATTRSLYSRAHYYSLFLFLLTLYFATKHDVDLFSKYESKFYGDIYHA